MKKRINKLLILFIIIFISINSLGCSEKSQSINGIKYKIIIWTDEDAILYLPLPLDLPSYTVSDLMSKIEIMEKSEETQVSYEVINTTHGYALKISTAGDVVLYAKAGEEYFETHPEVPVHPFIPGQDEPMFFDVSLQVDQTDKLNYERWAYLETKDNSSINIKVFEWIGITTELGYESWTSLEDNSIYYGNFTLKPGWQIIGFEHFIGYH
ncbi:MAG: hypothetical protein KAJ14_04760 [Candidatus Omnitrophica bacterium]|nr:hypothetical protein [Candidatus Omnitrophota bacterium]